MRFFIATIMISLLLQTYHDTKKKIRHHTILCMKKVNNKSSTEILEDVYPLPGARQTHHFLSSPLARHGEVAKALPVVRLEMKKLLGSDDAVVGLELLAITFADKHMATVLPNYVLVRRLQRLESLFTYIAGVIHLHILILVLKAM